MLNLFKQKLAQVLLLSNTEGQLFVWHGDRLEFIARYRNESKGYADFETVQQKYAGYPMFIVTNLIEESFRNDRVPHVVGRDRSILLERKLDYTFRKTKFRVARILERDSEGRRDNRISLSALTKPALLNPWLAPLLHNKTPVQGISSSAFLTETYLKKSNEKSDEYVLMVSLDKNSELRQTFMKKGKVMFSRLTALNPQGKSSLGEGIYNECVQIRSYLERVRLLPYESPLKIRLFSIYSPGELGLESKSSYLNIFESTNIKEDLVSKGYSFPVTDPSPNMYFLVAIFKKTSPRNVYAPFNVMRYFHLKRTSSMLSLFSIAVVILSLLYAVPGFLDSWQKWQRMQQVVSQTLPLQQEYSELSQGFPETPIPSSEMELVVSNYEKIKDQSLLPTRALGLISELLPDLPNMQITEINWKLVAGEMAQEYLGPYYDNVSGEVEEIVPAILEERARLQVTIGGIAYSPSSYREAQNLVLSFSNALDDHPEITVTPLKMPTDIRLDTTVTTIVDGSELRAEFLLQLDFESLL